MMECRLICYSRIRMTNSAEVWRVRRMGHVMQICGRDWSAWTFLHKCVTLFLSGLEDMSPNFNQAVLSTVSANSSTLQTL